MKLYIPLPSGNTAVLGTFFPLELTDLKRYIRMYERAYIVL